jgi:hypothetical protein
MGDDLGDDLGDAFEPPTMATMGRRLSLILNN